MSKAKLTRFTSDPVRIAAFCFKNLKKTQVLDADISSAVGKSSLSLFFIPYTGLLSADIFCFKP